MIENSKHFRVVASWSAFLNCTVSNLSNVKINNVITFSFTDKSTILGRLISLLKVIMTVKVRGVGLTFDDLHVHWYS